MSEIIQEPVEVYLARLADQNLPTVFVEMHAEASRRCFPIVGPEVGRFFLQLAKLRQPRRVLELGSGFGYSAIWWALGAGPGVEIHCTEYDDANIELGRAFAQKAGVADRIIFHQGDALTTARDLRGPWDVIFCDIDKTGYPIVADFARERLRPGDLLIYDNILWSGRVAEPTEEHSEDTRAIIQTTQSLYNDPTFDVSLLPIRDGVLMARRTV